MCGTQALRKCSLHIIGLSTPSETELIQNIKTLSGIRGGAYLTLSYNTLPSCTTVDCLLSFVCRLLFMTCAFVWHHISKNDWNKCICCLFFFQFSVSILPYGNSIVGPPLEQWDERWWSPAGNQDVNRSLTLSVFNLLPVSRPEHAWHIRWINSLCLIITSLKCNHCQTTTCADRDCCLSSFSLRLYVSLLLSFSPSLWGLFGTPY